MTVSTEYPTNEAVFIPIVEIPIGIIVVVIVEVVIPSVTEIIELILAKVAATPIETTLTSVPEGIYTLPGMFNIPLLLVIVKNCPEGVGLYG